MIAYCCGLFNACHKARIDYDSMKKGIFELAVRPIICSTVLYIVKVFLVEKMQGQSTKFSREVKIVEKDWQRIP